MSAITLAGQEARWQATKHAGRPGSTLVGLQECCQSSMSSGSPANTLKEQQTIWHDSRHSVRPVSTLAGQRALWRPTSMLAALQARWQATKHAGRPTSTLAGQQACWQASRGRCKITELFGECTSGKYSGPASRKRPEFEECKRNVSLCNTTMEYHHCRHDNHHIHLSSPSKYLSIAVQLLGKT
jgi:hypothetical protein